MSPSLMRNHLRSFLLAERARTDLRSAMTTADKTSGVQERINAVVGVLNVWAESDPEGAVAWAKELPKGTLRHRALDTVIQHPAMRDPATALEPAQTLGSSNRNFGGAFWAVFNVWAAQDPQAATAWFNTLTEGPARTTAPSSFVSGLAQNSPEDAARYAALMPPGEAQNSAASIVVSSWAQNDPAAAAQWASTFPEGQAREQALKGLISNWASSDPEASSLWLANLPAGKSRESAINRFIGSMSHQYPEYAAPFAEAITDERQWNSSLENIARNRLRQDPEAAAKWLGSSGLPHARQQKLIADHQRQNGL